MPEKFEVVISGVSGRFPGSVNFSKFERNLFGKVNLVTNNCRWQRGILDIPTTQSTLEELWTMDNIHFGINDLIYQAFFDPGVGKLMETAFETIHDAGYSMAELNGTMTGVFMATTSRELDFKCFSKPEKQDTGYSMLSSAKAYIANRLSYYFNLRGPSTSFDASEGSSSSALKQAYEQISNGYISAALVGCCHYTLDACSVYHYCGMSKITYGTTTNSYAADADGFNIGEYCTMYLLQRADTARRTYGTILNIETSMMGSRECGIGDVCQEQITKVIRRAYEKCGVDPSSVCYVEGGGMALKEIDAMELNAFVEIFCAKRKSPLLVGSVSSNMGHTTDNTLLELAKAIITLKTGNIPPNINYSTPNTDIAAIANGKVEIVTESTPLEGDIIAVNSLGIFGWDTHIVLKRSNKNSKQTNIIRDSQIPKLITISGRDKDKVHVILDKIEHSLKDDVDLALIHQAFKSPLKNHLFRGFTVIDETNASNLQVEPCNTEKRPIWYIFSGMGSQWPGMGCELLKLPAFEKSIRKCQEVMTPKGVDLYDILTNTDESVLENILNAFVAISAIQVALVDILVDLGVTPDGIIGHSLGELGCSYADGCLTAEQTVLAAYSRGKASLESKLVKGKMAAVGLGYEQIKDQIPPTIEVACRNSTSSCTLSGPEKDLTDFVATLKKKGIFCKVVNVGGIAYHSKYIRPAAPVLKKDLEEIIPNPKPRSTKWVSSSVPKDLLETDATKLCSAEYHTNNLLNYVYFEEACTNIPPNAICIEISPHGLLQAILRRSLDKTCTNISLTNRSSKKGLTTFFSALGSMYINGIDMDLNKIYPVKLMYPVPSGSCYIHPLFQSWIYDRVKAVPPKLNEVKISGVQTIKFHLFDREYIFYNGRRVQNRIVLPISKYIEMVTAIFKKNKNYVNRGLIILQEILVKNDVELLQEANIKLELQLMHGTGMFEVLEEDKILLSGNLSYCENFPYTEDFVESADKLVDISKEEVYKYLQDKGLTYESIFQNINTFRMTNEGFICSITWTGNWTLFLDTIFSSICFYNTIQNNTQLQKVDSIKSLIVDMNHYDQHSSFVVDVSYNSQLGILLGPKLKIFNLTTCAQEIPKEVGVEFYNIELIPCEALDLSVSESLNRSVYILIENLCNKARPLNKITLIDLVSGQNTHLEDIKNAIEEEIGKQDHFGGITSLLHKAIEQNVVIADSSNCEKACEIIMKSEGGFLVSTEKLHSSTLSKYNLSLVANQNMYFLYKKEIQIHPESLIIFTNNKGWQIDLEKSSKINLNRGGNFRIYVVTTISYLSELNIVNKISLIDKNTLRFVFIDDKAPSFNLLQPLYKNWLAKDLNNNVYWKGKWAMVYKNKMYEYGYTNLEKCSEIPDEILSTNIRLSYLGPNLKDLGVSPKSKEWGIFDYSGVDNSSASVCGLGYLSEDHNLVRDPHLIWRIPESWSHQQAATVPLPYTLAYLCLIVFWKAEKGDPVLVHAGYSPLSIACIRVALSIGCNVFTTYRTKKQRDYIKTILPELPDEHICSVESIKFTNEIAFSANSSMKVIVNLYDYRILKESLTITGEMNENCIFQLGTEALENQLGLGFLNNAGLFESINSSKILKLKTNVKEDLWDKISTGIKTGVVVPLLYKELSSLHLIRKPAEVFKSMCEKEQYEKLIVPSRIQLNIIDGKVASHLFNLSKPFVIIGTQNGIWLDLMERALDEGVKELFVVPLQQMSDFNNYRLELIVKQYQPKSVTAVDVNNVNGGIKAFMQKFSSSAVTVFVISIETSPLFKETEEALNLAGPHCEVIYFGSDSGIRSEKMRNYGHPSFSIEIPNNISYTKHFLSGFWQFLKIKDSSSTTLTVSHYDRKFQEFTKSKVNSSYVLPSYNELEALGAEPDKCAFEEVITSSPLHKNCRDISPVFIIPGLRPDPLQVFISKLMHPAFLAKIPNKIDNLDSVAQTLVQDILKFKNRLVTLISADWGGALAIKIGKLLELNGKKASVILLDAAPDKVQLLLADGSVQNDINLLQMFVDNPIESINKSIFLTSWGLNVNLKLQQSDGKASDLDAVRKGLFIMKNRAQAILNLKEFDSKFEGFVNVIRPKYSPKSNELEKFCSMRIHVQETEDVTYEEMLESNKTSVKVNKLVFYEYSAARNYLDFYHQDKTLSVI